MKTIKLNLDPNLVALAGKLHGKTVFDLQVKKEVAETGEPVTIEIPGSVQYITSSFVQGFFGWWLKIWGEERLKNYVTVKAGTRRIIDFIWDNLR